MAIDTLVVRLVGDSGDGIQIVGEQLTITAALTGRDVRTLPDFPAEIRAPAGTVGGLSGFQLAMAEHALFTAGESLDVLVALNPAALKHSLEYLNQGGLLIMNEDSMQSKDWEKAGISMDSLVEIAEHHQLLVIPLITNTLAALKGLELTQPQAKKAKNFYILGLVLWLFDFPTSHSADFIDKKFKSKPVVQEGNKRALMAGYNYAMTLELSRREFILGQVNRAPGEYRQLTGVEAIAMALATLATGTKIPLLVSGYPITPASAILQEASKLHAFGVELFQAEDEIAAMGACLGAAFGGRLALTCTSGPGLDLKSECLGLGVVSELPLVLINVQRAGASTGMPTKTSQSDLYQALYGRHGEAPLPVLAAKTPVDCFYTVIEAFRIAIKAMTPVIVLLDAYLVNAAEPWLIPDPETIELPKICFNRSPKPFHRDEVLSRSWNIPGSEGFIHQLGGLEKQGEEGKVSYDAENHQAMVNLRAKKIALVADDYEPLHLEGSQQASLLLIGWGSTYGSLHGARLLCEAKGYRVAHLHLRHLNPLPHHLGDVLRSYKHICVAELNAGQLCDLLRAQYLVDARSVSQCNGQPFAISTIVKAIEMEISHEQSIVHA